MVWMARSDAIFVLAKEEGVDWVELLVSAGTVGVVVVEAMLLLDTEVLSIRLWEQSGGTPIDAVQNTAVLAIRT